MLNFNYKHFPYKNNISFMRRLVISYSILLLLTFFVGLYLYNISILNVQSSIEKQTKNTLTNSVNQLDTRLISMSTMASQFSNNRMLIDLSLMNNNNKLFYYHASQVKDSLVTYLPAQLILPINSYFIYMPENDFVISFSHFSSIHSFYAKNRSFNLQLYNDWLTLFLESENYYTLIPVNTYSNISSDSFWYVFPLKNTTSTRPIPAKICFEIDSHKLNSLFEELSLFDSGYIYVTDTNNNELFSITGTNGEADSSSAHLSMLTFDDDIAYYSSPSGTMVVTKYHSNFNGWSYYLVQPQSLTLYSLDAYQQAFIFIIIAALIIGFVVIYILSYLNTRPMVHLHSELNDATILHQSLQEVAEQQRPIVISSYLKKIMKGTIKTEEEFEYIKKYLDIVEDNKYFQVLYCNIYVNTANKDTMPSHHDDIVFDAFEQIFPNPTLIFSPKDRTYALLLSNDVSLPSIDAYNLVETLFNNVRELLISNSDILIYGGLGNSNNHLSFSWKSFQQAKEALSCTTSENFFQFYEQVPRSSLMYYYPAEFENQFVSFVKNGNKMQVVEFFKLIQAENFTKRRLTLKHTEWLISDIFNTLIKIRYSIDSTPENSSILAEIDSNLDEFPSFRHVEDIALQLCDISTANTSENQLIANIKEYILNNFHDSSLCLSHISDVFSISENYFSYLFKSTTSENFSSYLEKLRMEKALHLVKQTNTNLSEIYEQLGYNNSNTFRRVFKKTYGVSPKTLRDS